MKVYVIPTVKNVLIINKKPTNAAFEGLQTGAEHKEGYRRLVTPTNLENSPFRKAKTAVQCSFAGLLTGSKPTD